MMNHDGLLKLARNVSLIRRAEISAPLETSFNLTAFMSFMQQTYSIVVVQARERRCDGFEPCRITLKNFQLFRSIFKHPLSNVRKKPLTEIHHIIESGKCHFGFDHPELRQMAARL